MKFSGLGGRLYRGETSINIISARKKWYTLSGVFVALSIFALSIQGLALGIEFKGGSSYTVTTTSGTIEEARTAVTTAGYTGNTIVQTIGSAFKQLVATRFASRPALLSQPSPMRSKMR